MCGAGRTERRGFCQLGGRRGGTPTRQQQVDWPGIGWKETYHVALTRSSQGSAAVRIDRPALPISERADIRMAQIAGAVQQLRPGVGGSIPHCRVVGRRELPCGGKDKEQEAVRGWALERGQALEPHQQRRSPYSAKGSETKRDAGPHLAERGPFLGSAAS